MKKNVLLFGLLTTIIFASCASKDVEEYSYDEDYDYTEEDIRIEAPEITDDFIGDFGVVEMENMMFLSKTSKGVKPKEIKNVALVPRMNCVELTFRDTVNEVTIQLNKAERQKIMEACELFLQQYEEKTIPHHKVTSKTAYFKSKCKLWFGVIRASNECSKTDYYVNCEFIEKRPYILIHFSPSRCDESDAFTPKISLYMSPTQIRNFLEVMDQEHLNSLVKDLSDQAYIY